MPISTNERGSVNGTKTRVTSSCLSVRLKLAILDQLEFPVSTVRLCSDSQIIIKCIRNTSKKFPVFVMSRLHEIRLNRTITEWNYVRGSENPADMSIRYTPLQQLLPESVWINGPSLLYQNNTKVSENAIYNLSHEFDSIESSCLNSMTKHQE